MNTMAWCLTEESTTPRSLDDLSRRFDTLIEIWKTSDAPEAQKGLATLNFVLNAARRIEMKPEQAQHLAVALLMPDSTDVLEALTPANLIFVKLSREHDITSKEGFISALESPRVAMLLRLGDLPAMHAIMKRIVNQFFDACKDPTKEPAHKARLLTGFLVLLHAPRWVIFADCFAASHVIVSHFTELTAALAPKAAPTAVRAWGSEPRRRI
jgi:hypothetical protein